MGLAVWAVIFLLIALNALYVAAEFSAVGVRLPSLRRIAAGGSRIAARLLPELDRPARLDRYVAISQIGITASSLVLGAYGQATLAVAWVPYFEHWGKLQQPAAQTTSSLVVLFGLTILQMVLGELVPKTVALQYSTRTVLATALPMRWSGWLFAGFLAVLNGSGLAILRLLGVRQSGHRHIHAPEEIELLIAQSHDGGLLEPDESRRLRRALRLGRRRVRELMVPRTQMTALDADLSLEELLRLAVSSPYSRLPVFRGSKDNVLGSVHVKDIAQRQAEGGLSSLQDVLRPAVVVPESMRVDQLLLTLRQHRAQQAVVLDEYGGVAGLISISDVLREILGELADKVKTSQPHPERLGDGRVRLPGQMRLDRAAAWTGVRWQGEGDTIGGRVLREIGALPRPGDRLSLDGVEIEVEAMRDNAVVSVLVRPRASVPEVELD